MPRPILACLVCLATAAAGCDQLPSLPGTGVAGAQPNAPLPYPATVSADAEDPANFAVAVATGGAPLAAIRESVRFPATRYCLAHAGTSDIAWTAGAPGAWTARLAPDGRSVYTGRCTGR